MGDLVFASLWAPGAVCAVSRESGELLWMRDLDSYASSSVFVHGGVLYATSVRTLYALDPKSGRTRWEFSPKRGSGEWIYSQPAVKAGRVFLGDRCGYLHCLEAKSGKLIWRRQSSRDRNNQVNSTAVIAGGRVITANNQGAVICYSVETGKTLWRQQVDAACISELLRLRTNVVVAAKSLYCIDLKTGAVRSRFTFPKHIVTSVAVLGKRVGFVLGTDFEVEPSAWNNPLAFNGELFILEQGREKARQALNGTPHIRFDSETGVIYAVNHSKMVMIDSSDASTVESHPGEFALPDVSDGNFYALSRNGELSSRPVTTS